MATATTLPKSKAPKPAKSPKATVTGATVTGTTAAAPTPAPVSSPAPSAAQQAKAARRRASLLKQVSDATRLQILAILAEGEMHVGGLCARVGQSQPAVSHHLALCRHGGLIEARRDGKNNFYSNTDLGRKLAEMVAVLD